MTKQDRLHLLEEITLMVLEDFGEADDDEPFNPFSPADVARQAVIMLQAAYEELEVYEEMDKVEDYNELADQLLEQWKSGEIDSDNLATPS